MILTTAMMPKDMIYTRILDSKPVLGSTLTCDIQGFMIVSGTFAVLFYNCGLCFYYLCSISWKLEEEKIRKIIEPLFHIFTVSYSVGYAALLWKFKLTNPDPTKYPFCGGSTVYPWWCISEEEGTPEDESCVIRGSSQKADLMFAVGKFTFFPVIALSVIALMTIVYGVYSKERSLRIVHNQESNITARARVRDAFIATKDIMKQALAYMFAFMVGYLVPAIIRTAEMRQGSIPMFAEVIILITMPLQGVLNLSIFVWHRIRKLQHLHPDMSTSKAILTIFREREEDAADDGIFLSQMVIVGRDNNVGNVVMAGSEGNVFFSN